MHLGDRRPLGSAALAFKLVLSRSFEGTAYAELVLGHGLAAEATIGAIAGLCYRTIVGTRRHVNEV